LSLVTRLLGIPLGLAGGILIGYAQGVSNLVDAITNLGSNVISNTPNLDHYTGQLISSFIFQDLDSRFDRSYGSYWVFGILLLVGSFVLISRGDRKPVTDLEREGRLIPADQEQL
jgi:hypothetical protein